MKFDAFIGGSYQSQAATADCERTINWYPELLQSPGATSRQVLYPTPGVEELSAVTVGLGRAHFAMDDREFAVIGTTFYEISASGALTSRGTVTLDSNPATISSNGSGGDQLFVTSGGNGYIYDLTANTLAQIAALDGKATFGDHLDGYFLALDANTATLYISHLLDGVTWDTGLDFAQRSLAPDPWRAMRVVGRYIWLFGEQTSEVWYDTGANFPFAPHPSGLVQYGIAAPFSAVIIGGDVVWMASTKSGRICVLRASGFTPEVISTYPLETAFGAYKSISSAVGDAYADAGHTFYLLGFDLSDVTWAWDSETKLWHERGTWISGEDRYVAWRPRFYARAFGQHRMLDASGGSVYRMGLDLSSDVGGLNIRRLRRAPAIMNENQRVFYAALEVDLEPGLADPVPTTAAFEMHCVLDVVAAADPAAVNVGADVTFTPTVTGCILPYTYLWDFGDALPTVNTTDLYGYWPLDEASGNPRAATLGGAANLVETGGAIADIAGRFSNAVTFGADNKLVATFAAPLDLSTGFTFAIWFYPNAYVHVSQMITLSDNGNHVFCIERYTNPSGVDLLIAWLKTGAIGTRVETGYTSDYLGPVTVGAWNLVVAKYDPASGLLKARLNGNAFVSVAIPPALGAGLTGFRTLWVGGHWRAGYLNWDGRLDDVRFWTSVLTDAEMSKLWYRSDEETPTYNYGEDGVQTVTATVTSANGCTATDTVDVTVDASVVTGLVADDADPVNVFPGASVYMTVDAVPWPGGPATTNGSGVYSFTGVPAGAIVVTCSDSGYSGSNNDGAFAGTGTLTLDIVMTGI